MNRMLIKITLIFATPLWFSYAASIITIYGTGTSGTSAHITVTTNADLCPDEFVVESGASLTTWDPSAICSATTSGGGDISLPVELTSFFAYQDRSTVVLEWVTESEIDNLGFIVERRHTPPFGHPSQEGTGEGDWVEIASYKTHPELQGQGSVTYRTGYRYVDSTVVAGATYDYRLADVSYEGVKEYHTMTVLGVTVTEVIPDEFAFYQNYPNPFNPVTTIRYDLPEESNVTLVVYNLMGREVRTLVNNVQEPGHKSVTWDGADDSGKSVSTGVYIYRLTTEKFSETRKMVLLR